jgi:reactive intermediate/imine deaminase
MNIRLCVATSVLFGWLCSTAARPADIAYLSSGNATARPLPFSEAVRVGRMLYLSGQIGVLPGSMTVVPGGLHAEAKQAMDNIKGILERHGYSLDQVVKCTVMLTDMADWPAFNEIYVGYFPKNLPARSAIGASALAVGAHVEVECWAAK